MPFQKGQIANPKGGPTKAKSVGPAIMRALQARYGNFPDGVARIADALIETALDREHPSHIQATKEIFDRLDGKAPQAIGQDSDLGPIVISWAMGKKAD